MIRSDVSPSTRKLGQRHPPSEQGRALAALKKALSHLRLPPQRKLAVACSAGADSMALLLIAHQEFRGVRAFHVDHGTRDGASTRDARWLRQRCRELGIPCHIRTLRIAKGAGFETRARTARYAAFEELARRTGTTHLLLAHHADDQAETVALRLERGSGARGLAGMQRSRKTPSGLVIVRPFLHCRRAELRLALASLGASWREDATNAEPLTRRNVLRQELEHSPDHHAKLVALARASRSEHERTLSQVKRQLRSADSLRWPGLHALSFNAAQKLPHALRGAALEFLLQPAPSLRRQDHQSFSRVLDGDVLKANLSGGWSVEVDGAWLLLTHQRFNGASTRLSLSSASSRAEAALLIHVRVLRSRAAVQETLALALRDPSRAVLALEPTQLLPFAAGLRYTPIGAQGRKLVSDALREHTIPRILRNTWPLVADDLGVLWAPGLPPAERARVLDSTALAFALTCTGPLKKIIPGAKRQG